ncbi:hypothetical protein B9Q03_01495 [Candidatus Marsarchaeota G2 archaeon OSP_D]|uniref:Uncharacterized protein n=1 Tax=Candidatus Marsarchaeota G2 archaeon OSP_D TaxID=1978157 RepID=A0A2R6B105_9ARCH|nr:MAG: hypothetical protein B9Q03_01495 [Candidatus Marsarchaeota G2 archaeon OSP_D]
MNTSKSQSGQALILAALMVAATIYSIYAISLNYTQTTAQPTPAELYTQALNQALAEASQKQNTTYATQLFEQYIQQAIQQNTTLKLNIQVWGQPAFQYYGYNQNLCVGCNTMASATLGPYSVNASLTLISENSAQGEYTLLLKYTVNGQNLPIYEPTIYTSTQSTVTWNGNRIQIVAHTANTFELTVITPWGLTLQCLL